MPRCVRALLVAGGAVAVSAAAAFADTNTAVETRLARVEPSALYPTRLPERLQDADVSLSRHAHLYTVIWDRGLDRGRPRGYVDLDRSYASSLRVQLAQSRRRGFHPRRVMVGTRRVWYLCGHICGYEFVSGRYAYGVFGFYYTRERKDERDMRAIVKALQPVGVSG
jgi:hypothetical protein